MKFCEDKSGVSVIIGAMLLFAIIFMFYATVQAVHVPIWNAGIEWDHWEEVSRDMRVLRSDIEDVAFHDFPKTSDLRLGTRFPDRMFLINPSPGVSGTLTTDTTNMNITITIGDNNSNIITLRSTRIIYTAHGTIGAPKLVYEHGIIIQDWGEGVNLTGDTQQLIVGNSVYLIVLNGTCSAVTGMGVETLNIVPLNLSENDNDNENDYDNENVTIILETNYTDIWRGLLANVAIDNVNVYNGIITIRDVSANNLRIKEVGIR